MTAPAPLAGVTILDLSRVLSGPYCTMLAADMGARVIKVEHPDRGDDTRAWGPPFVQGESAYYLSINRNKESIAIDFKQHEGRRLLESLLSRADVLVENFRPGTLDAYGFGYADVSARHPGVVYVSISGFGQTGPRRGEPGYDAVAQAESGLMSVTGHADSAAVRVGVAIADISSGMFAFQGMLLALIAKMRSGRGQLVDVGLLDSVTALLTYQAGRFLVTGDSPPRAGNRHLTIAPYDAFETRDGVLILAVGNDRQWQALCALLNRRDLADADSYRTNDGRVTHYHTLKPSLQSSFSTRKLTDLVDELRAAGVPAGAVRSIDDALRDPQIVAREMIATVDHPTIGALRVLGVPVKLSDSPGAVRTPPPRLGEHTRAILDGDLGLSAAEIARLAAAGVVRTV